MRVVGKGGSLAVLLVLVLVPLLVLVAPAWRHYPQATSSLPALPLPHIPPFSIAAFSTITIRMVMAVKA